METPSSNPSEETSPATSLPSRLFNVFAAPGDVFEEVKASKPSTANWFVPVLLGCLMGIIYSMVVFSQDNVLESLHETQEQAIRTKLQKNVDAGKMSKQQVDQAVEMAQKFSGPTMMKVFGSVGAVVASFAMLFFIALIFWVVGAKLFKGQFSYMKGVEAVALAGMINVLGVLIGMLLAVMTGNLAMTPGPVLLVHDFNPANKLHVLLSQASLVMFWYIAVLAIALSKLSGTSFGKAAAWLFGIWAVLVLVLVLPGWGR